MYTWQIYRFKCVLVHMLLECFSLCPPVQEACLQFSYPVEGESDSVLGGQWGFDDAAMTPWRTVLVLPATRLEYSLTELDRALDS